MKATIKDAILEGTVQEIRELLNLTEKNPEKRIKIADQITAVIPVVPMRRKYLKVRGYRDLTDTEIRFLYESKGKIPTKEIAKKLGLKVGAVYDAWRRAEDKERMQKARKGQLMTVQS